MGKMITNLGFIKILGEPYLESAAADIIKAFGAGGLLLHDKDGTLGLSILDGGLITGPSSETIPEVIQQDAEPGTTYPGLIWVDTDADPAGTNTTNIIKDADGDTKVDCEESSDEDIVRIDAGGNEIWVGLASGEITKPLQPCFIAHATEDQVNIANTATVIFGTVVTDQGSDFAANAFTAPVTGSYQINMGVYAEEVDGSYTYCRFNLVTSNQTYYNCVISPDDLGWASDPDRFGFNASWIVDMDAEDTVHIVAQFNGGAAQMTITNASYFSAALIC